MSITKLGLLREELKSIAIEIRKGKLVCKEYQKRHGGSGLWEWRDDARDYRHKHIVYCLLRGKTMEQIENKNREHNEPNASLIKKYMEEYSEEALHIDTE